MMARRRNIYRRTRRRSNASRVARGTAAAIAVAALLYFAVAGGLGAWIADRFIAPNMGAEGSSPAAPATPNMEATPTGEPPAVETSEEVVFEAMPLYAIQLGAFANAANAEAEAERFQRRGAAGYIYQDEDRARVLASVYREKGQAESVSGQLIAQQGVENYILELFADAGSVTLRITAQKERIEALTAAIAQWREAIVELEDIAARLDSEEIGPTLAQDDIRQIAIRLEGRRAAMTEGAVVEGADAIDKMEVIISTMVERLSTLSNRSSATAMEISSQIKYTYVDSMIRYGQALRSIF